MIVSDNVPKKRTRMTMKRAQKIKAGSLNATTEHPLYHTHGATVNPDNPNVVANFISRPLP
jgi:hypothetical protein